MLGETVDLTKTWNWLLSPLPNLLLRLAWGHPTSLFLCSLTLEYPIPHPLRSISFNHNNLPSFQIMAFIHNKYTTHYNTHSVGVQLRPRRLCPHEVIRGHSTPCGVHNPCLQHIVVHSADCKHDLLCDRHRIQKVLIQQLVQLLRMVGTEPRASGRPARHPQC